MLEVRSKRSGAGSYGDWERVQEDAADLVYQSSDVVLHIPRADQTTSID